MMETKRPPRWWVLLLLAGLFLGLPVLKAVQEGWFEPRLPLELNNQPALVFFTLSRGCECQMVVVAGAEAQLAAWPVALEGQIPILRVDFDRRPDLVRRYGVARAPALVLLDDSGQVVWKQDVGLSDDAPLDLDLAEIWIEMLVQKP